MCIINGDKTSLLEKINYFLKKEFKVKKARINTAVYQCLPQVGHQDIAALVSFHLYECTQPIEKINQ
jgi:hypothetical protein